VRSLSDPIVANLYRRTSDGRTLFCPWGNFGRAYIVPPDREEELSSFVRRLYLVMLGTIPVAAVLLHWWAITLAPVFTGIWFYKYWSFSRTLEVDPSGPPPFDRRQAFMNAAGRRDCGSSCVSHWCSPPEAFGFSPWVTARGLSS
jgi:hypothetical protein